MYRAWLCIRRIPLISSCVSGLISGYSSLLQKQNRCIAGYAVGPEQDVAAHPMVQERARMFSFTCGMVSIHISPYMEQASVQNIIPVVEYVRRPSKYLMPG